SYRAVMLDAKLTGTKTLPANQTVIVIFKGRKSGTWLTHPKRGLNDGDHPGVIHGLVVIRSPRYHMDMGVKKFHPRNRFLDISPFQVLMCGLGNLTSLVLKM